MDFNSDTQEENNTGDEFNDDECEAGFPINEVLGDAIIAVVSMSDSSLISQNCLESSSAWHAEGIFSFLLFFTALMI